MSEQTQAGGAAKTAATTVAQPDAKPAAAAKPPKKLVPRIAPKPAAPAKAATKAAPKVTAQEATVERHRQELAAALVEARAKSAEVPAPATAGAAAKPKKAAKPVKAEKVAREQVSGKAKKPKLVRDSYAMPEAEYARIGGLKKRLAGLGVEIKKSELLRAGVLLLAGLADGELMAVAGRVERIKTGRPAKK